jgi:hypothetical protein
MSWLHAAPILLVTIGIIALLGMPIAAAVRAKNFAFVFTTIPAAFAVLAVAPVATALAGKNWGIAPAFLLTVLVVLVCLPFWKLFSTRRDGAQSRSAQAHGAQVRDTAQQRPRGLRRHLRVLWRHRVAPLAAAALGGLLIFAVFVRRMWSADAVSQTYDANFHLNLVAEMLETGNASPLNIDLSSPGSPSFYPALWHAAVTLIVQVSHASIPLATNALMLVTATVIWTIGGVALSRTLFGPSLRVTITAGIVSAVLPSMPYAMGAYGILYPTLLATALLPYAMTALAKVLNFGHARATDPLSPLAQWILLLGSLGAMGAAQPSGVFAFFVLAAPAVIAGVIRTIKRQRASSTLIALGGGVVFFFVMVALWVIGQTADNDWETRNTFFNAFLEGAGGAPRFGSQAWAPVALALVGIFATFRWRRMRWLGVSWLFGVLLFAVADGLENPDIRTFITGPWYNDSWRLSAIIAVALLPLIVFALDRYLALIRFASRRIVGNFTTWARTGVAVVGIALLTLALQSPGMGQVPLYIQGKYDPTPKHAKLLDDDERALLERLPDEVPKDAIVVNNPWNGGALAQAISGREVLFPHTGGVYPEERYELADGIATGTPEACKIANSEKAQYVLDFGTRYVFKDTPRAEPFENITDIKPEEAWALTEVDRQGDAVLYRVTGC